MEAEGKGEFPDTLRCRRNDGKQWRCSRRVVDNLSYCQLHQIQARHRAKKMGVPDSLKLKRGIRRSRLALPKPHQPEETDSDAEEAEAKGDADGEGGEATENRRKEGMLVELVRLVIRRKKRQQRKPPARLVSPEREGNTGKSLSDLPKREDNTDRSISDFPEREEDTGKSSSSLPDKKGNMSESSSVSPVIEDNMGQSPVVTSLECDSLGPSETIPNRLRCQRTDGKQWRCRRAAVEGKSFCQHHLELFLRQQRKHRVPACLKFRRRGQPPKSHTLSGNDATRITRRQVKQNNIKQPEKDDGMLKKRKRNKEKEIDSEDDDESSQKRRKGCLSSLVSIAMRRKDKKRPGNVQLPAVKNKGIGQTDQTKLIPPKDQTEVVPDHLRCKRSDGKLWRCKHRALDNLSFCELHHIQAVRRQYKLGVPDSLKLKRKPRGLSLCSTQNQNLKQQICKKRMADEELKKAKKIDKIRKKNESLLVEVMSLVLQRQVRKREESERKKRQEATMMGVGTELTRDLPNGFMSIAPADSASSNDAITPIDKKIGLDSTSFLRWCFRSKKTDPPSVGPLKMLPHVRKATGLKKRRKRVCHRCRTSFLGRMIINCSRCRKVSICRSCLKKWYSGLSESTVRTACPPCRGKCSCSACKSRRTIEGRMTLRSA